MTPRHQELFQVVPGAQGVWIGVGLDEPQGAAPKHLNGPQCDSWFCNVSHSNMSEATMMAQRLESTTSIARARSTVALFDLTTSLGQIARNSWHLKSLEA
jgi:hypothetical protein